MNRLPQIFDNPIIDGARHRDIQDAPAPSRRYVIAFTRRAGSSYLCDVMKKVGRFGKPDEVLNQEFVPAIVRKNAGRTPDECLRNGVRVSAPLNASPD